MDIKSLGDLTEEVFEENKSLILNDTNQKRAKHAVYENQRTLKAVKALQENDINTFGKLMVDSHNSLKDDYEVTGKELDTLVELALNHEGTIGSRMTGAGFGGCTVSIVKKDMKDDFIKDVSKRYREIIGYDADFYVAKIGDGTRELV
ncbi:GHMP kinase domain protein [[Clostridium] sordellii ATCC 9714]|nr:GHMP kinase domain protein [[Clostridium] sordellii ATCC 9714] [Paeniclostridium sordellii ATCC 9714]